MTKSKIFGKDPKNPCTRLTKPPHNKRGQSKNAQSYARQTNKSPHGKTNIKSRLQIGDKVRVFNSYNNMWDITGEIIQEIPSEDGISRSFLIKDEEDTEIWRNAKFIKLRATQ